jgi:hypothetical protein
MKTAVASTPRYRTITSFVAVHFDEAGKGQIVFLPCGVALHVIGPSACLPGGFEVMSDNRMYNVFDVDLWARSIPICERIPAKVRVVGACA